MYPVSLKISGFKSFAEPASLFFSLGVSAVVGPNGCGKSNIIEALRWVMGEGSARRLRSGSDMEEVIFAGSKERPPFSRAEVTLQLESVKGASPQELHPMATNAERADNNNSKISGQKGVGLLAQLRGEERISISRRIESGGGSSYRINGKEALARDVQTLCADMGLGANASALVGQGQIAELVNAKPLERRLLIEEAAGVRGLYSRRSDALSGLENTRETLARVEEYLQEDAKRLKSLEQESSRAERYRELSKQIKRLRAAELAREDSALEARLESLRARVDKLTLSRDSSQALLAELDAQIAEAQEKCRIASEKELESAAHCQRLGQEIALLERSYLDLEEKQRGLEQRRVAELRSHGEQEQALVAAEQLWRDALAVIATSESSVVESGTKANTKEQSASEKQASDRLAQIDTELVAFEKQLTGLGGKLRELERQGAIYAERLEVSRKQKERIELELAKLSRELQRGERVNNDANNNESSDGSNRESQNESKADNDNLAKLSTELSAEISSLESSNEERQRKVLPNLRRLEDELVKRRESLHSEHLSLSTRLQAECDKQRDRLRLASSSLTELDDGEQQQAGRLLLSELKVPPDLSLALFGALGDDLFASLHKSNIRYWLALASPENGSPPPLPAGISSLASLLELPSALRKVLERRLEQIGLVSTQAEGASLQGSLREGQRLVSRDGSSWRWDGLQSGAGVAVAAEQRYQSFLQWNALKRGLAKSEEALQKAKRDYATACSLVSDKLHQTHDDYQTALADEKVAIERLQDLRRLLRATESRVREQEQQKSRVAQLNLDLGTSIETGRVAAASLEELAQRPELERQRGELEQRRQGLLEERAGLLAERRRASEQLAREQEDQRARVDNEQRLRSLKDKNSQVLSHIVSSVRDIEGQLASLSLRPARDLRELDTSRKQHRAYETRRAQDKNAFERLNKLLADKQERRRKESLRITELDKDLVRLQTQGEHLPAEREQLEARSQEELSCSVSDLRERYSLDVAFLSESLDIQKMARRSAMDKRARLGDINFAARQTLAELKADHEQRQQQQRDVSAALSRLSLSVRKLEAEASSKLSRVLEEVGACFSTFIARLFGGGEGQIFFSDSSDPINSGLEISLSLPGKRIKSLSSMSGGEQALVAISLILSVFSVAGGKFCILDEVDAALDDGNVSRFCDLLDDISRSGSTRFLVITHHHYTMSRAVRLYGVAMPEPGCSSIVSVALEEALEHARVAAE